MFATYFQTDPSDGEEYGRCAGLIESMLSDVAKLTSVTPGSLVAALDIEFADANPQPSKLLKNALDHALQNLQFVTLTLEKLGGYTIPVTALMSTIRTSLLGASHLAYVISGTDPATAAQRMGALYRLEINSSGKYIKQIDTPAASRLLAHMRPPQESTIRALAAYDAPHRPSGRLNESVLLDNLKTIVLPRLIAATGHDGDHAQVIVDHLFNTTSGAAHGYAWIDADGVVAQLVPQLSFSTTIANVVYNDYLGAILRN